MKTFSFLLITALLFASSVSQATYKNYTGTLTYMRNGWNNEGYYWAVSGISNGCTHPNDFIVLSTSPAYQQIIATAMMAYSMGKTVIVETDGTCPAGGYGNVLGVETSP